MGGAVQQVLFIQGAGSEGAHEEDRALAESLGAHLGPDYKVWYPLMPNEAEPDFDTWNQAIHAEVERMGTSVFLAGHSIGASVLAKVLTSRNAISLKCLGLFLIAGPFWHDDAFWRWDECGLSSDAAERLPPGLPVYLYHGEADPFVPIAHLDMYSKALPEAVVRRLPKHDHQLNEDLSEIARDIVEVNSRHHR